MTYWTLEYNGVEKSLADWGISEEGLSASFGNMVVDTFEVPVKGALITDAEKWPYEGAVIIRRGRTLTGSTWSGGAIEFSGKRLLHVVHGRPGSEDVVYQFGGPWYDLEMTPYLQECMKYAGSPLALTLAYSPDCILFQKLDAYYVANLITNGEQITRILQHCLTAYSALSLPAPFQIGTIGVAVNLSTYQVRDLKCSEAIHHCMRASPDATVAMDYSTSPPTINVVKRASMTAVSIAGADLVKHEAVQLTPRYDLQPRSVALYFRQTNTSDDSSGLQVTIQKYPVDGAEAGPGVIVSSVELDGWHMTTVSAKLVCLPVTNDRTFWKGHFPDLRTTRCRRFRVGPLTYTDEDTALSITLAALSVTDKDGAAVSLTTYPNMLLDGSQVASWMKLSDSTPVVAIKVKITAEISCKEYDIEASGDPETSTNGRLLSKYLRKQVEAQVTLTNAVTGDYQTIGSYTGAEAIPTGLAQSIYESLSALQYQGSVSIVEAEPATAVTMGKVLNLTGLNSAWATMGALIQTIRRDYGNARGVRTTITVGPAAHLSAGDLTQLFLVHRYRRTWKNPACQASGKASSGDSNVVQGDKTPGQNSIPGLTEASVKVIASHVDSSGNKGALVHDGDNAKFVIHKQDAAGAFVSAGGRITLSLADTLGGDSVHHDVKLREMCVTVGGVTKTVLVHSSEPYDLPA